MIGRHPLLAAVFIAGLLAAGYRLGKRKAQRADQECRVCTKGAGA